MIKNYSVKATLWARVKATMYDLKNYETEDISAVCRVPFELDLAICDSKTKTQLELVLEELNDLANHQNMKFVKVVREWITKEYGGNGSICYSFDFAWFEWTKVVAFVEVK